MAIIDPKTGLTFEQAQKAGVSWTAPAGAYDTPKTTTPTPAPTPAPTLESIQAGLQQISAQIPTIQTGIQTLAQAPIQTTAPELPSPTAVTTIDKYSQSLLEQEQKARAEVEQRYQTELNRLTAEKAEAQKRMDELTAKTKGIITEEVKPLLEPFRADLEKSERERLEIEENYFANQRLVGELESLLTQIQADVKATKEVTGLASIREPRISKATEDAMARVGVIEATMAARNNQINVAYGLIDRTISAMEADRTDQLNYYNTLINFYDKQRDEEGNKIISLEKDQKEFINAQIGLLENDLTQAQTNANYIKSLMINPETAQFMADAGITLNDTPAQVNAKMAEQSRQEQVADFTNNLKAEGYEYVPYPAGRTDIESFEIAGQTLWFKPPAIPTIPGEEIQIVDNYANKVMSGELNIANVPANIRNAVVNRIAELEAELEAKPPEIPAPPDYVASFTAYKNAGWTREQVENSWIAQYNQTVSAANQIKNREEMYKNFPEIKAALDEVYGKAPGVWQKVTDWWSNLWK